MYEQFEIKSLRDVKRLVSQNLKGPLAWLGKRGLDAVGIKEITGMLPLIICADSGKDVNQFSLDTLVLSIENAYPCRYDWSTTHLSDFLATDAMHEVLKMLNGRLTILPYQSTEAIELLCLTRDWQLLSNPMHVKNSIENKMQFPDLVDRLGLGRIYSIKHYDITQETYASVSRKMGKKAFVIQYPAISSGKGTFFVNDQTSFEEALKLTASKGTLVRVADFIKGSSPNVNCVCTQNGIVLAPHSYQIIGVEMARKGFGSYCGNQWLINYDSLISNAVYEQAEIFGNYIYKELGYLGIFGLDYVSKFLLEINARVNGGTQTMTQLLLNRRIIPPMAFHILEMLGVKYTFDVEAYNQKLRNLQLEYFHLVLNNNADTPSVVTGDVPAGVHTLSRNGKMCYLRHGYHIGHAENPGEFVITSGVPRKGLVLAPGAALVKIQGPGIVYDPETGMLNEWGEKIVSEVRNAFALEQQ